MATTVHPSENTVTFTATNNTVSVTNNNTGTKVNITGTDLSTVTISSPGPKGDKGVQSYGPTDDLSINNLTVTNISASGDISSSGNIYSDNIESIPLSFLASSDGTNWYGPNTQGPYYYVYNYSYGDDAEVRNLDRRYIVAGTIVPYKCTCIGFKAIVSKITDAEPVTIQLLSGSGTNASFNKTSGTAANMALAPICNGASDTPGAAENPMTISVTNNTSELQQGDVIYTRVHSAGSDGSNVSMQILLKRKK